MKWLPFILFFSSFTSFLAQSQESANPDFGFQKVIWVVLENTNRAEALKEPFFQELLQRGAFLANMSGEWHPSQPNYIAMISGTTHWVLGDYNVDLHGEHLGDLLESHGRDWKNYAEDYPGGCFKKATSGKYARKHVPFMSFLNVTKNPERCAKIVSADQFDKDLAANELPDFSMYTPNLIDDGHNTNAHVAAAFIQKKFGPYVLDADFMKDKLFVLTFDESETYLTNKIYTVLVGGKVLPGSHTNQALNHVSVLRLIEEQMQLGFIGYHDAHARLPSGIWQ